MKIAVGISGGVDSTVAAMMLKADGHEITGVTMTVGLDTDAQTVAAARALAVKLGIGFRVFDFSAEWRRDVLDYVKNTYLAGETPNPCVRCNETVKFSLLPRAAFDLGCEAFATGHYARTVRRGDAGAALLRSLDAAKDQSYFLYRVERDVLARTLFPLGELAKGEVRERARAFGLEVSEKPDSQDFCAGDVASVIGESDREGDIVDASGKVLGRHRGYWHYTHGKRKGLGIGGGTPYYVTGIDARRNEVVVGFKADALKTRFEIVSPVWREENDGGEFSLKVRSAGDPKGRVRVVPAGNGRLAVESEEGLFGVAPGQSAVFYRGDEVVGGGIISKQTGEMPKGVNRNEYGAS